MSNLGNLYFTLGVKTDKAEKQINEVLKKMEGNKKGPDLTSTFRTLMNQYNSFYDKIKSLENELSKGQLANPKFTLSADQMQLLDSYRKKIVEIQDVLTKLSAIEGQERNAELTAEGQKVASIESNIRHQKDYANEVQRTSALEETAMKRTLSQYIQLGNQIAALSVQMRKAKAKDAGYAPTQAEMNMLKNYTAKFSQLAAEVRQYKSNPKFSGFISGVQETTRLERQLQIERELSRVKQNNNNLDVQNNVTLTQKLGLMKQQKGVLSQLANYAKAYVSVWGAVSLVKSIVRITGEFEQQRIALRAMLQDIGGADAIYEKIKNLAVVSPFSFRELTSYAKQLTAFSVPINDLYGSTKMLADLSAGLGVGMDRLVLAYGQVKSAAFLRGQEVRQFTEAGLPILDELAEKFSDIEGRIVSAGEVFDKISRRQVSFEMVNEVLQDLTSEGGKFYNMQEVLADSVKGKLSNLRDAYEIMLNEIGEGNKGVINNTIELAYKAVNNYKELGKVLISTAAAFGVMKAAIFGLQIAESIRQTMKLRKELGLLTAAMKAFNVASMSNVYAAIGAAIAGLISYIVVANSNTHKLKKTLNDLNSEITKNISGLDSLYESLNRTTLKESERKELINKFNTDYGEYLDNLLTEKSTLEEIAEAYGKVKNASLDEWEAKYKNEAYTTYGSDYNNLKNNLYDIVNKAARDMSVSGRFDVDKYLADMFADISNAGDWQTVRDKLQEKIYAGGGKKMILSGDEERILWNPMIEAAQKYEDKIKEIDEYIKSFRRTLSGDFAGDMGPAPLEGWRRKAVDILSEAGLKKGDVEEGVWADASSEYYAYIDNLRKGLQTVKQMIVYSGKEMDAATLKAEQGAIERIFAAFGVPTEETKNGGGGTSGRSAVYERLEKQLNLIKQINDEYKGMIEYTSSDILNPIFAERYSGDFTNLDLANPFEKLKQSANESLKGDELTDFLEKLDRAANGDWAQKLTDKFREQKEALDRLLNTLEKWGNEDFTIEGTGIDFDVNKVLRDYTTELAQLNQKKKDAEKDLAQSGLDSESEEYRIKSANIDALYKKELDYIKKLKQERLNEIVEGGLTNALNGIKTGNWRTKSDREVKNIYERLKSLKSGGNGLSVLDDKTIKAAERLGFSINETSDAFQKLLDTKIGEAWYENFERGVEKAKTLKSAIASIGDIMTDIGNDKDNDLLKSIGNAIDFAEELADVFLDSKEILASMSKEVEEIEDAGENIASSADWITMIVKVVLMYVEYVVDCLATDYDLLNKIVNSAQTYRDKMYEIAALDYDSIFGVDSLGKLTAYIRNASDAYDTYFEKLNKWISNTKDLNYIRVGLGSYVDMSGLGQIAHAIQKINEQLDESERKIASSLLQSDDPSFLIEAFQNMDDEQMQWLIAHEEDIKKQLKGYGENAYDEIINAYKSLQEQNEQVAENISSIFESLADSIIDNMVSAYKVMGDATLKMEETFTDLSESIVESILQSALLENVLEKYEDEAYEIYQTYAKNGNKTDLMGNLSDMLNRMKEDTIAYGEYANALLENAEALGMLADDAEGSMSSDIQAVTEDTAQLLTSYINAMRADLSSLRNEIASGITPQIGSINDCLNLGLVELKAINYNTLRSANNSDVVKSILDGAQTTGGAFKVVIAS